MSKLTGNNKDFLFKISKFFKEIVLEEEVDMILFKKKINDFTTELIDDGVIEEDSIDELKESLIKTFLVMLDNRQEGKFGQFYKD